MTGCYHTLFHHFLFSYTRYNKIMNYLSSLLLARLHYDVKTVLLYRFHLVLIVVNIIAILIDTGAQRTTNAWIETGVSLLLITNVCYLLKTKRLQSAAILFLVIVATGLFIQIWLSHFGTMSVIFVLLLPLTAMPFIPLRYTFMIEAAMITVMAVMLYQEYLVNPENPIFQNPKALFHLGYTALIIFLFGLLYHFSIRKTLEELDTSNKQKELLLKEVHHRVKNNLNVIASIIGLQTRQLSTEEQEELLKSKVRIESIAMVHEMLYRSDDLTGIDFASYAHKLSDLLLKMYGKHDTISVKIESDVTALPLETMIQLGIMINEMLTNSIKYAFRQQTDHNKTITMTLHKEAEAYHFCYEDNGQGVGDTEGLMQSRSLGIKLVHLTAKQLGGTVEISSPKGLKYDIRFPT